MKILITGINGFAGSFLAESLIGKNNEIGGTVQPGTGLTNIFHIKDKLRLFDVDLLDEKAINSLIQTYVPDVIYHLAGLSSVKESFDDPKKCFNVNIFGSINLLEGVKKYSPNSVVLLVSSAEIYGESLSQENVVSEKSAILPKSPYAASKASLDMLGRVYALSSNLKVVIARPGSHIGPRQSDVFFVPTVIRQIVEIIQGKKPPELFLGDLNLHRDFTDVRDVVEAYKLLAQKGKSGEAYNICSAKQYLLKDIVDILIKLSGKEISIKIDSARLRKNDLRIMRIDNLKIVGEIGWQPKIPIEQTLKNTFNYWLNKIDSDN